MRHRATRTPTAEQPSAVARKTNGGRPDSLQRRIDEALEETFPASDPPFWTLGSEKTVTGKR